MILFLDTSGFEQLHFVFLDLSGKIKAQKKVRTNHSESENTLQHLDKFLKAAKVKPEQISKIYIVSGPGSFTGIRVGFSHALAFALAFGIPVYAIKKEQVPKKLPDLLKMKLKKLSSDFIPEYGRAPNIT